MLKLKKRRIIRLLVILFFLLIFSALFTGLFKINQSRENSENIQAEKIFAKCKLNKSSDICYQTEFTDLTKKQSLVFSIKVLSTLQDIDPNSRSCHLIAHSIASAEIKKSPENWPELLKEISAEDCNGGYLHGIIEGKTAADSTFKLTEQNMEELCLQIKEAKGKSSDMTCIHFMGHLALIEALGDIPNALSICSRLSLEEHQDQCFGGIFMESEERDNLVAHGLASDIEWNTENVSKQENICRNQEGLAQIACWRELSRIYAVIYNNPQKIYEKCNQSPNKKGIEECYNHAMGYLAINSEISSSTLNQLCQAYILENAKLFGCIDYVNGFMLITSANFAERTIALCNNISTKIHYSCFKSLSKKLDISVPSSQRANLCKGVPYPYHETCINGGLLPVDNTPSPTLR